MENERAVLKQTNTYLLHSLALALIVQLLCGLYITLDRAVALWLHSDSNSNCGRLQINSSVVSYRDHAIQWICVLSVVLLFLLLRLGTFRLLPALSKPVVGRDASSVELINSQFNHKETDELIFQV